MEIKRENIHSMESDKEREMDWAYSYGQASERDGKREATNGTNIYSNINQYI